LAIRIGRVPYLHGGDAAKDGDIADPLQSLRCERVDLDPRDFREDEIDVIVRGKVGFEGGQNGGWLVRRDYVHPWVLRRHVRGRGRDAQGESRHGASPTFLGRELRLRSWKDAAARVLQHDDDLMQRSDAR
jgi:hypothetical protein